jgi:hypothetical protein
MTPEELNDVRELIALVEKFTGPHPDSMMSQLVAHVDQQAARITALEQQNAAKEAALRDIANLLPKRSRLGKDAANFVIEDVGCRARKALGEG